jgi:prepilin-type processing-associated H-X9-DG protein
MQYNSDGTIPQQYASDSGPGCLNNYYSCYGTTVGMPDNDGSGLFGIFVAFGMRDMTDGSSSTIAFSEALAGKSNVVAYKGNGVRGTGGSDQYVYDASTIPFATLAGYLQQCVAALPTNQNVSVDRGLVWACGIPGWTMFNTVQLPDDSQFPVNYCRLGCNVGCHSDNAISAPASSQHTAGVNVLMGDGSVRFIKDTIARRTWFALGTKAGNESISADSF